MKDWFTVLVFLLCCAGIYVLVGKIERYLSNRNRNTTTLRIACENSTQLRCIRHTMDFCAATEPRIQCSVSRGKAKQLIRKIEHGSLDLILISSETAGAIHAETPFLKVPYYENSQIHYIDYMTLDDFDGNGYIYLIWNPSKFSQSRNRFLFSLQNHFRLLTCGYCDYIK